MKPPPWNSVGLWAQYHRCERKTRRPWRVMKRTGHQRGRARRSDKLKNESTKWFNKMVTVLKQITGEMKLT